MQIEINIPEYSETGIKFDWDYGFEITGKFSNGEMVISANKAGLVSLARHLLTLAQDDVPFGYHLHLDKFNSLGNGSVDLILLKQ